VEKYIEFGKITATHGLKGEIFVDCFFKNIEHFLNFDLFLKEEDGFKKVKAIKNGFKKDGVILKIEEIESLEVAKSLVTKILYSPYQALTKLDDGMQDTHFVVDLIGLQVLIEGFEGIYGKINDVVNFGGGPLLEVNLDRSHIKNQEKADLTEYHLKNPQTIKEVNIEKNYIIFKDL
jgi:16S rRNA processing protein RimM